MMSVSFGNSLSNAITMPHGQKSTVSQQESSPSALSSMNTQAMISSAPAVNTALAGRVVHPAAINASPLLAPVTLIGQPPGGASIISVTPSSFADESKSTSEIKRVIPPFQMAYATNTTFIKIEFGVTHYYIPIDADSPLSWNVYLSTLDYLRKTINKNFMLSDLHLMSYGKPCVTLFDSQMKVNQLDHAHRLRGAIGLSLDIADPNLNNFPVFSWRGKPLSLKDDLENLLHHLQTASKLLEKELTRHEIDPEDDETLNSSITQLKEYNRKYRLLAELCEAAQYRAKEKLDDVAYDACMRNFNTVKGIMSRIEYMILLYTMSRE